MTIPLPNLDDRTYDELLAEARALIPALTPEWTNFNESDPGITLLELFAWLTEMILYRVNQVPEESTIAFLGLLNGPDWEMAAGQPLEEAIHETMARLRRRQRAVTAADYEALARRDQERAIARVHCLPNYNLEEEPPGPAKGHVSVIVVPRAGCGEDAVHLARTVQRNLEEGRLLTVRNHVTGPFCVSVRIGARLFPRPDAPPGKALAAAQKALRAYFDPVSGGPEGNGWPFGRDVYAADVYALCDRVAQVNYVEAVNLAPRPGEEERLLKAGDEVVGVRLAPHELVAIDVDGVTVEEGDA